MDAEKVLSVLTQIKEFFSGIKTYIVGCVLIIVGVYLFANGEKENGLQLIGIGATAITLRAGIKKIE